MKQGKHSGGITGAAHLNIKIISKGSDSTLVIDWQLPVGSGTTTNPESGLIRPFRSILSNGKPVGKIVFLFYEDKGRHYVLGTLCRTEKRILFFPSGDSGRLLSEKGTPINTPVHIDHFTLEESYRNWHITLKEKATQGAKLQTKSTLEVYPNLFLWFVIQANSVNNFEKAPSKLHIELDHKTSELRRRGKNIKESREDAIFQSCLVNDDIKEPHVINFEFFINLNGPIPFGKIPIYRNLIDNPLPDSRRQIPNRVHSVKIPTSNEIVEIRVSKFAGSLSAPWNYSSGHDFSKLDLIP